MKLYLQRNDKNIEKNKQLGEDKYPYFTLSIPPEVEGAPWIELAAFWKSKSGKGYNGMVNKKVTLDVRTVDTTMTADEIAQHD